MRISILLLFCCSFALQAQVRRQPDASKIKLDLKKLNVLGTVLYLAAHPDDENSRAIAYFVNDQLVNTGYLSLTRGDGGQNLIGPEFRDLLGLIRTQELLSARRLDGGQQFFTRANDFGFSKSAKETFQIWNKDEVMSDVIHVIRQFQPDVILTRFPPDERAGHGQHTASAILAQEAFDLSNNPAVYPEQVKQFGVWKVKRVYWNTSFWWGKNINENTPGITTMNMGTYNPLLGMSYSELAAESRSQHKSQGFGSSGRRGDIPEYFELSKGDSTKRNVLEGVNTTWTRVKGGVKVQPLVEKAIKEFNSENPALSVTVLLQIRSEISKLEPSLWKTRKLNDVNNLIQNCLGLYAEVTANQYWLSPGDSLTTNLEILNRSLVDVRLTHIQAADLLYDSVLSADLKNNNSIFFKTRKSIRSDKSYSGPYWLKDPHDQGLFTVKDQKLIGKPENDPALIMTLTFTVQGEELVVSCPVIYKWTDPVKGELSRPFEIVPPVFLNLSDKVFVFPDETPKDITVLVKSATDKNLSGKLRLSLPVGWKTEPTSVAFESGMRGQEKSITFRVFPTKQEISATVSAIAEIDGKQIDQSLQVINYDHIPIQTLLPKAQAKLLRIDIKKEGGLVGYIRGAGDEIPAHLRNMGYQVWEMKDEEVTPDNLRKVDAVVLGVRALNTNERIRHYMPDLLEYVKAGGTMIVQYNTNQELEIDADKFAPYALSLSRDRVTEENSEARILKPDHPALSFPNKITQHDFDGWIQERGLYFPNKWDSNFEALLSFNDVGEPPRDGGLLVANYGTGHYVYTGLSFFRELPEGVPGAYRLFANLVSLGKNKLPENTKVKSKGK